MSLSSESVRGGNERRIKKKKDSTEEIETLADDEEIEEEKTTTGRRRSSREPSRGNENDGRRSGSPPETTELLRHLEIEDREQQQVVVEHNIQQGTDTGAGQAAGQFENEEGTNNFASTDPDGAGSVTSRVYKKCASNGSIAVYVGTRTLTIEGNQLEPLKGVIVIDRDSLIECVSPNFRIFGQITLTFRYGREDEEVLGLRFCNEAILALKQLWPPLPKDADEDSEDSDLTPLQAILLERVRSSATSDSIQSVPFALFGGPVGLGSFPPPPSVLLAPAKPYKGSPIGTIYDLRIYASERPEEKPPRKHCIRLAIRAVQRPCSLVPFDLKGSLEARPTFLSRGKIKVQCELNTNAVRYGEPIEIQLFVQNNSKNSIRRVMVSLVQQVDVCMFTSGKFKNVVGCADDVSLIVPGSSLTKFYTLSPLRCPARQWLALEEAFGREPVLAPTTSMDNLTYGDISSVPVSANTNSTRNIFAIIVSYYVKTKLVLGGLSLCQNLKVPFVLLPPENADPDPYPDPTPRQSIQGVTGETESRETGRKPSNSAEATTSTTIQTIEARHNSISHTK